MNNLLLPLDLPASPVVPHGSAPALTEKLPLELAEEFALRYLQLLRPHCHRIELAGSIRRRKPMVHDIEIVCIERYAGAAFAVLSQYRSSQRIPPKQFWRCNGPRYKCFLDRRSPSAGGGTEGGVSLDVQVDLFITEPQRWGWTYFIRTGSQDWNKAHLQRIRGMGYLIENNRLLAHVGAQGDAPSVGARHVVPARGQYIEFPEEQAIFDFLGLPFVEPHLRIDKNSILRAQTGNL